jgi:hypothetical protein
MPNRAYLLPSLSERRLLPFSVCLRSGLVLCDNGWADVSLWQGQLFCLRTRERRR